MSDYLGQKKSSLLAGNQLFGNFFYHSPTRIVECVSEYTFLISKNNKQTTKQESKKREKLMKKREYLLKID